RSIRAIGCADTEETMVAGIGRGRGMLSPAALLAAFLLLAQAAQAQSVVQLIAQKNAIRTTVYSNADGRYEFPKLEPGTYTLRIARPREFHPFVKEKVEINGSPELPAIALTRVTNAALLPPLPQIAAQMTGSEWLLSLSGTGEEKRLLTVNCNWCHSYQ